jgi:hypothetical protein
LVHRVWYFFQMQVCQIGNKITIELYKKKAFFNKKWMLFSFIYLNSAFWSFITISLIWFTSQNRFYSNWNQRRWSNIYSLLAYSGTEHYFSQEKAIFYFDWSRLSQ